MSAETEFEFERDERLMVFINSSKRCCGFLDTLDHYEESIVFVVGDCETDRVSNASEVVDCTDADEISLVSEVIGRIDDRDGVVNIDVSVLNRIEFLYLLRSAERIGRYDDLRLLYAEPDNYLTEEYQNSSMGIEKISSIPGFRNETALNKPLLLIMLLGFEPTRSMAIYNNVDPDRTYLILPEPPYKPDWEGRTARKNSELITTTRDDSVREMHSYDVDQFVTQFREFIESESIDLNEWNCRISPLSTKPQALGVFKYWREHKGSFSFVHSTPLKHNKLFDPDGIADRHVLKEPGE